MRWVLSPTSARRVVALLVKRECSGRIAMSRLDNELREILMDLRYTQDQNLQKPVGKGTPNPTNVAIEQIKMAFESNFTEKWDHMRDRLIRLSSKVGNLEPENIEGIDILIRECLKDL